jgi:DNA polymerase-3 subunit epsilon
MWGWTVGFYARTSLKAGPFRFTLSPSGVGVSVGIPGFRVAAGPRGNYVRVAGLGTTYFGGQSPTPVARSGRPIAPHAPNNDDVVMQELGETSVQQLVAAHPSDLINQIQTAARRRSLWPWVAVGVGVVALAAAPYGLLLLVPGALAVWWLRERDQARRSVVVFYRVEDAPAANYERFAGSSGFVSRVHRVWHIEAEGALHTPYQQKVNANANALVRRSKVLLDLAGPRILVTNIAVPSLHGKARSVYFLPDKVLVRHGREYAALPYAAVSGRMELQRSIESEPPPADAQCVGTTWQYANKSGGPDRRFKNNRRLPIMLYGRVTLTSPQGILMVWDFSRPDVAASLVAALNQMR